ncbi:MAG: UvrD-helicase domain-containing protein [Tunicatimonas sp.]
MTAISEKPFVIYRSSAGSGKTYTLALEYLTLALRHPTAYRGILAVTFTNKATQEMKTRIVAFLYQLANGENQTLREAVIQRTALTDEALTERAQQVLRHILHGYSYFAVMTIDAFFQKVVRAFAREMNLQAGFSIELDEGKVLEEVIDELLLALGDDHHRSLRRWLTRFAEEKVETGQSWDFRRDIKTLARELFKEDYRLQRPPELPERDMGAALKSLRAQQQQFEQQMQQYGQQALAVMERHALAVEDFAYGVRGVAAYFPKLATTTDYEPGERVKKSFDDPHQWYTKSSKNKEAILAAVEGGLRTLLGEALEYHQRHKQVYYSVVALSRFVYTHGILHHLEAQLQTYQRAHDLMLISDAPLFLKNIIGDEDTPFIYEKMGTTFQNFLIDEFQDTSGLQWANFRPLVENSLSAGQRNLVVGDVKQSIYRWRGGDWQLLLEKIQRDVADYQTEVRDLDRNYRSRRHIVDFNNALFAQLSELLYQTVAERLGEVTDEPTRQRLLRRAEVIRAAYARSEQTLPPTYGGDWHGHVRIQLLEQEQLADEAGDDVPWKDYVKAQLPAMVERLQDQGYALHDIAFLVRNKRDGQEVAATFMDYKNQGHAREGYRYEVISPESLYLNASLTVGLLVEVLRFLDNPSDRIAQGSILHRYRRLRNLPATSSDWHREFAAAGDKNDLDAFYRELPPDFRRFQEYLNKLPLYELVENLVQLFGLSSDNEPVAEAIYLQAFQDAVLNYSRAEQGDLHAFLQWWEERGQKTSLQVPEAVDAMRIMTIHKAKGLQFKVVILPFCTWDTDHHSSQTNILWSSTSVSPLDELGLMPLRYDRKLADTVFDQEYYEELIRVHMDNLNLLYVAFTRAEACLYAFAPPKKSKEGYQINSVANALRQSFTAPPTSAEQIELSNYYDESTNTLELGAGASSSLLPRKNESFTLSGYPSVRWRDRLMVRPTSRGYFADAAQPGVLSVNLAGLLREVLVRIRHYEEADRHLQDVYYERGITQAEREQLARRVTQALNDPTLRAWYEHTGPVMVQRTLLTGQQRYICPDRVMLPQSASAAGTPAAGTPAANATVVHFGLANEQAEHQRIIKRSVTTLRSLGYAGVKGYWVNTQTLTVTEAD